MRRLTTCFLFLIILTGLTPRLVHAADSIQVVDSDGFIGVSTSLVLDNQGFPVISYYDNTNQDLKVAHCNDANCTGGNESIQTVDADGRVGEFTSLVLDSQGFPIVSYYDFSNGSLKVLHCNDANCTGSNESIEVVDTGREVGWFPSLVLDSQGFPIISYHEVDRNLLKVVHCNDANCAGGDESIRIVDNIGLYTSLALDSQGFPVVSYYGANTNLKLLHCNNPDCVGGESVQIMDNVGLYTSLILDNAGFPVVSYFDGANGRLKIVHCNDANCAGSDENSQVVDALTSGDVGISTSLALDNNGFPVISYYDYTNGNLKVVHCDDPNCAGNNESIVAVDTGGDVGGSTSLKLDSQGFPVVSYYDFTNGTLKVLHCDDANCEPTCGNSVIEGTEQCDDGNTADGDCCSSSCQFEAHTTVCRAAVGECDVAENCSGASADCPGDTVKTNGTACTDDGNACSADICNGSSTACQHPAGNAGTVCRASTGACDVAETCTGDNLRCPADTGAPDSDNDGQCDAIDLCTNSASVISGKLILANFATGNGDDTLNFSGTLAFTTLPALDPIANGVRVRLEDADGALFDVTVPGGVYNTVTKTGWKLNAPSTQWRFSSPIAVGGAITQVTLTKKTPQIKFVVKGKKGAFAALPVTAPVTATLVLTPPLGLTGACSDVSFSGAQCAFNAGQKTLTCQR